MFFNSSTIKTFALAAAASLPAVAHAEDKVIERDGVRYEYNVKTEKGRTVITGTADRLTPFRLIVRGDRVTGEYNGKQVAFTVQDAKREAEALAVR